MALSVPVSSFDVTFAIGMLIIYLLTWRFFYEAYVLETIHTQSVVSCAIIVFGSSLLNIFLFVTWYTLQRDDYKAWRNQPSTFKRHQRHEYHWIIYVHNFVLAVITCGWSTELIMRYRLWMSMDLASDFSSNTAYILFMFVVSVLYECVMEYYWHRVMHLPWFYATFHKLHHYYKSPQPFDDLIGTQTNALLTGHVGVHSEFENERVFRFKLICLCATVHPLENFGYYLIMYSPPFILSNALPIYSFILYMIYLGLTGVLDHSGIQLALPYVYDTNEHDLHHRLFNCNYSFPHPFMDYVHGTHHSQTNKRR